MSKDIEHTSRESAMERLPKWARDRIMALEQEVEELRRPIESATPTRVAIRQVAGSDLLRRYLAENMFGMEFDLRSGHRASVVRVTLRQPGVQPGGERGEARVLHISTAEGGIVVRPEGSNSITVEGEPW